jgi:hypothetical protein
MSVLKAELKQLVTHEVGVRVDDALEAARRDLNVLEGRQGAFIDGAKAVELLQTAVDRESEEGQFDLKTAAHIKRYVTRAVTVLQNLSAQAGNVKLTQVGRISGLEYSVSLLKGIIDEERKKADALRAAEESGARPVSIKEQRQAEEAEEQAVEVVPVETGEMNRAGNA